MSEFEKLSADERDWLAFRYAAGELSGNEAAAFEAELESSQIAREAVARAVDLSQVIALAESHEVEVAASRPNLAIGKPWIYIGWVSAGVVAASVAGAVLWNMQRQQAGASNLAEAWSKVREVDSTPLAEKPAEPTSVVDVSEPEIAPSWMTAGVISLSGGKVDDSDGDGKPDESWDDEVMEN